MKRLAFSDPMMRALAAGEKTMTRRISRTTNVIYGSDDAGELVKKREEPGDLPRLKVGDLVAATCAFFEVDDWTGYRFSSPNKNDWNPARIMPAALAPFVLRITAVRAERLGEITDSDAMKEGMFLVSKKYPRDVEIRLSDVFKNYWKELYGQSAWERDCDLWVWVYSFEIAERRV